MNHKEQWDTRFSADDYIFGTSPNVFLTQQAYRLPASSRILAVADGEGRNGVWLAEQGHHVLAVDISPVGQAKAARLAASRGVMLDLHIADVTIWAWEEEIHDAVIAIFIQFADPALRTRIFAGMQKTVRPGGLILLQGYRPEQVAYATGGPRDEANLYNEVMLRDAFAGWHIEHLAAHDDPISEGTGHSGMSALIDMVARKPG